MNATIENSGPIPQGLYAVAKRQGDMIFTSGMTPRKDGVLLYTGPVDARSPIETYRDAVLLASNKVLHAARGILNRDEKVRSILSLTVFVASDQKFTAHSKIADFASEFFRLELGEDGVGSRAAVGVSSLPGNATVEIQAVFSV